MKILKSILMSLITLAAGFAAIAIPFNLFKALNTEKLYIVFATEIAVYFIIAMLFLVSKELKENRKAKEKERRIKRREEFSKAQEDYYSLAA